MELPTDLLGIIGILDKEVPNFTCEEHGFSLMAGKGTLGRRWDLVVKHFAYENREMINPALGRIELEALDQNHVQLRVSAPCRTGNPRITRLRPWRTIFWLLCLPDAKTRCKGTG